MQEDRIQKKREEVEVKRAEKEEEYLNFIKEINIESKNILSILDRCMVVADDPVEVRVIKYYIQTGSINSVRELISKDGFKLGTEYKNGNISYRKYSHEDVREILLNKDINVDEDIEKYALSIYEKNRTNKMR